MTIDSPAGLSSALDKSLQSLQAVSEGDSLCTLSGDRVEAAKYLEGRIVALKTLRRLVSETPIDQLAGELAEGWTRDYGGHASRDFGWSSYLNGLLDVCREVS